MPLISIALLCYNHEKLLPHNLKYLIDQSDKDFELILVDNQSTDNSYAILEQFKNDHPEMKIKMIRNNTRTVCEGRRAGVEAATGIYVAFHDGDDWLELDFIEQHRKAIVEHNYPDAIICMKKTVFPSGETQLEPSLPQEQTPWVMRGDLGYTIKREFFLQEETHFANIFFHDLFFSTSINLHIRTVEYIRLPLYNYFIFEFSTISKERMHQVGSFVNPFAEACSVIKERLYCNAADEQKERIEFQIISHYYSLVFQESTYLTARGMFRNYTMLRKIMRDFFPAYLSNQQILLFKSNCLPKPFKQRLWLAAQLEKIDRFLHLTLCMRGLLLVYWLALKLKVYRPRR